MEKKVKILKRPEVSELAGEKVMIDFESGKYFMLKGSANEIWEMLKDGIDTKEIVTGLMEIYDVEESVCLKSVQEFLTTLKENGFIDLV
ncbi:MAG: PqqD family protein [Lachnospiraceae bacterium]|nr:PqqD family protein [Lachnospiraceae bacterium]